jgi:hypothetical protein
MGGGDVAIVECEAVEDGPASEVLGSPVSPFDVPDMSIWDAVYWVAREGGSKDFNVTDESVWDPAIASVVSKMRSGEIPFFGQRSENAFPEVIPAHTLSGFVDSGVPVKDRFVHPYQGASVHADQAYYDGLRLDFGDPEGDRLFAPAGEETRLNLRINSADLSRFWPFNTKPTGIEGLTEVQTPSGHWLLQGGPTANSQPSPAAETGNFVTLSVAQTALSRKPASSSGKKRGVKPKVFDRVADAMRADLASGALTPAALEQMIEKTLEDKYSASRDTCRKARAAVLAERETLDGSQA